MGSFQSFKGGDQLGHTLDRDRGQILWVYICSQVPRLVRACLCCFRRVWNCVMCSEQIASQCLIRCKASLPLFAIQDIASPASAPWRKELRTLMYFAFVANYFFHFFQFSSILCMFSMDFLRTGTLRVLHCLWSAWNTSYNLHLRGFFRCTKSYE